MKVLFDWVFIRALDMNSPQDIKRKAKIESKSSQSIKCLQGEIVHCGDGCLSVKEKDVVLFTGDSSTIKLAGKNVILVKEKNIISVI